MYRHNEKSKMKRSFIMEAEVEYPGGDVAGDEKSSGNKDLSILKNPGGLCSTCASFPNCTFCKDQIYPVMFCDEYREKETTVVPDSSEKKKAAGSKNLSDASVGNSSSETEKYNGLCVNCKLRGSCIFERPEGGVWHCEEYC